MTDLEHDHLLLTLNELLVQIDNLRRKGIKTFNGNNINTLYNDLVSIQDRIDPVLVQG